MAQGMATELVEKLELRSALVMGCPWAWNWEVVRGHGWVLALALLSEAGKVGALEKGTGVRTETSLGLPLVKAVDHALAVGSAVQLGEVLGCGSASTTEEMWEAPMELMWGWARALWLVLGKALVSAVETGGGLGTAKGLKSDQGWAQTWAMVKARERGCLCGEVEMAPGWVWGTATARVWLWDQCLALGSERASALPLVLAKGLEWADGSAWSSEEGLG